MKDAKVSFAADVALPFIDVALARLTTKSGEPVVVRCEVADEIAVWRATERLPGGVDSLKDDGRANDDKTPEEKVAEAERVKKIAPPLIEAATALLRADGSWVRPAFYFGETAPNPDSIPGRYLRLDDLSLLVTTILQAGGYIGGAAESASFPDGVGSGRGDGDGAVVAGEGVREDTVGDGPGPDVAVQPHGDASGS